MIASLPLHAHIIIICVLSQDYVRACILICTLKSGIAARGGQPRPLRFGNTKELRAIDSCSWVACIRATVSAHNLLHEKQKQRCFCLRPTCDGEVEKTTQSVGAAPMLFSSQLAPRAVAGWHFYARQ